MNKRKILIIDGYNMIHRCRFQWGGGLAKGEYQIVYNFFRSLRSLVEEFSPDLVYFPLDGAPLRRIATYDAYKAGRKKHVEDMSDDEIEYWESFRMQKRVIINSLKSNYPIITVYHPDNECDDLVPFLIEKYHMQDNVVVVSSDTDFIQVLNLYPDHVKLYNPISKSYRQNTDYDYVTWKAMVGDKSDNIPGVKGIGKKTALKILSTEGELERRMENPIFKKGFTISYDLIKFIDLSEEEEFIQYTKSKLDQDAIKSDFASMGFTSMLKEGYLKNYFNTFNFYD